MTPPSVIIELIVSLAKVCYTQSYIVLLEILDDVSDSKYCQIIAKLTSYVYIVIQVIAPYITTDPIDNNKR